MKILRSMVTVGGLTGLSRILGLLRDMLIAALMGAGPVSDVFWVAFKMPNFFRRLLAEGAMAAAFVPVFSRLKAQTGYRDAIQQVQGIHTLLILLLIGLVVVMELATPMIMRVVAPGFYTDPPQFQLALELTRITFPYIFFIALAAFYGCILNTEGKFALAAASPVILNLVMIGALAASFGLGIPPHWVLAYAVLLAGFLQLLFVYRGVRNLGPPPGLVCPRLTPTVKAWLKGMAPGAIGAGAMQINILIDTVIASLLPAGSVSYLFYADRLNQLPLSLLGIGISTVLLPHLSQKISENKKAEAVEIQNRTLEYTLFFTLPAAIALIILGCDIICVLFERAEFTRLNVLNTGYALAAFALGLPAYVLIKIFSTIFFAYHNTKIPVLIGLVAIIINIVLNIALIFFLRHIGIALATSLAAWFNAACLAFILYRRGHIAFDERFKQRVSRIFISSLIMLMALGAAKWVYSPLYVVGFFNRVFALGGVIACGIVVYFLCAVLIQAIDVKEIFLNFFGKKTFINISQ